MNLEQIFNTIYDQGQWGKEADAPFYSGSGSHNPSIVGPYVQMVSTLLVTYRLFTGRAPRVVDVGCGDFAVGRQYAHLCGAYLGLDIVKPLVEHNQRHFGNDRVSFAHANASETALPECDFCIVRQVFQHLPNAAIEAALQNILPHCQYLILTEHQPTNADFVANREIPSAGNWVRVGLNSGVDITQPPFSRSFSESLLINEVVESGGAIRTMLHKNVDHSTNT